MNDESTQITSILSTLQKIMPTIIDGETKRESKMESKMETETKSETESETKVFPAVGPTSEGQVEKTGTDIVADTDNQAAIVVDGHSFLNTPLADNEIRKEEYTIVMKPDGKNEIIDSKTEKIIL